MNKLCLAVAGVLLCASASPAQTAPTHYRFDNFDALSGVRIETPVPPTALLSPNRSRLTGAPIVTTTAPAAKLKPALYTAATNVAMMASQSLDGFTTGNAQVDKFIVQSASRHGVDPVLLYAIMHRESAFKQRAISYKGARGLMQLMPATAVRFGVRDIFDPAQNIEGGARYVRFLLNYFDGDVALTLAGYNAGEGAVNRYGRRVPPYRETQEYVRRISERYALMRNPQTARTAPKVSPAQIAAIDAMETQNITLYERSIAAVRLPDGQLRLISQ